MNVISTIRNLKKSIRLTEKRISHFEVKLARLKGRLSKILVPLQKEFGFKSKDSVIKQRKKRKPLSAAALKAIREGQQKRRERERLAKANKAKS